MGVFKDIVASKDNFKTLQDKKYVRFEDLPLQTKTGEKVDVEFVANAYSVGEETIIQCNIRDITDRKKAEDLLLQSKQKYSDAFNISPNAIFIVKENDGKFIEVNNTFSLLTGYSRKEVLRTSSKKLKLWENYNQRIEIAHQLKTEKILINREFRFRTKSGEIFVGLISATKILIGEEGCILFNLSNINDRKKAEELVIEVKNRNESILNSIGDSVFACDKKGIIILFNQMAEKMTGISAKDAIGKNYKEIIFFLKESDEKPYIGFIAEAINRGTIAKMSDHVLLVRKDGLKIPVADSAAPIRDYMGKITGCVVVFHDVTVERQIDKTKTEFVSLASHQLRTPLSTINWYAEML